MKKVIAGLFVIGLAFFMIVGCAYNGTAPVPSAAPISQPIDSTAGQSAAAPAAQPASSVAQTATNAINNIDWSKVSQFYHTWVAGLIAPVGLAIATVADPKAGPAIAKASKEVANLDALLAAKASNADLSAQAAIVDQAITDADAKVGAALTAVQAVTTANPPAAN
jgi:hypothetical protein